MNEPAIVFDGVCKSYPLYHHMEGIKNFLFRLPSAISSMRKSSYEVLRDVSFEVRKGECLGIIGKNGSGKSTTLGLIAGVLRQSKGRIAVSGRVSPILELGGGFHPELTGEENIVLNGVLLGLRKKEVERRLDEIVGFSELGEFIDQPIRTYSSGMLARLGFSVVVHLDPEILLIDEVLAVGDTKFQKKCIDKMLAFKRDGITMVFVSHAMDDIEKICDRVVWIEDHSIKMEGKTREVVEGYTNGG
ncbi:MAG: ABC transporter ATP-binding protein [Thermodesulfobacteriota bacterium]